MTGTASMPEGWKDFLLRYDHHCHKCHRHIEGHIIEARAGKYKVYCADFDNWPITKKEETPMPWSYPEVMAVYLAVGKDISYALMKGARDEIEGRIRERRNTAAPETPTG